MFTTFAEEKRQQKLLTIHFILNGRPQKLFTHTFNKALSRSEAEQVCESHWSNGKRPFRFFSIEGVELANDELEYVRNGKRIYVSRGQDFDSQRNFGEYTLLKPLGEGGFGKVWLAKSSITQQLAAIKLIKLEKISGARDIDMVFREVENLKTLSHPNIVKIQNCYTLSNMQLVIVMEYLQGGDLLAFLKQKGKFSESEARKIFQQIILAISYCHNQNIIHRDLKLQNILIADKQSLKVKIVDFGISGIADTFNPQIDIGTLRYMAPQVLSKKEKINTAAVDVWACGVMLFCMIYGHLPFTGATNYQTIQSIISGVFQFPSRPVVTDHLKNVIACALQVDPKKRIISRDLQLHPWFTCNLNILPQEESFPEIPRPKVNSRENRKMQELKKTAIIPKRLQREKEQLLQQLKNFGGNKRKIHQSQLRPLKVGSQQILSPRYKYPLRTKQQQSRLRQKKRASLIHGIWK